MAKGTPFLFCRYSIHLGDELLDAKGVYEILNEIQGTFLPSGPTAEKRGETSIVVMKPRKETIGKEAVVTWMIGHRPGVRAVAGYNATNQELTYTLQADTHIVHTAIIAIPRLGAMAVSDRVSALNMGARPALTRTKAAFRKIPDAAFRYWFLQPGDIASIVEELDLLEYSYTVRRINPTPPGTLSKALDETYKKEGIGVHRGVAKPMPGETMKADQGFIAATTELASGGYGVLGFKGNTAGGHRAQIKKPPFDMDKKENLKQQQREHPLRVFIETDGNDDAVLASVVAELVRFYDKDAKTDLSEESA